MELTRNKFIVLQIVAILCINYLFLVYEKFGELHYWRSSLVFSIAFFHIGTFITLYSTITSKTYTKEKERLLADFNGIVYLGYITLLIYNNCQIESSHLLQYYGLGLFTLMATTFYLFETYSSYKKYTESLITNN
jgi:hypothetical protein